MARQTWFKEPALEYQLLNHMVRRLCPLPLPVEIEAIGRRNTMLTEAELTEYMDEIRKQVCNRCVERPPGGPPLCPAGQAVRH